MNHFVAAPRPTRLPIALATPIAMALLSAMLLAGCGDDENLFEKSAREEAKLFEGWVAPEGSTFESAMSAWDEAAASKSGDHPGWRHASKILVPMAEAGDARSEYFVGMLYFTGNGGLEFNHYDASQMMKSSADKGYHGAYAFMALMNERGDGTMFKRGDDIALENWLKAAEGRHCGALRRLAGAYKDGALGLTADAAKFAEYTASLDDCIKR